MAPNGSITGPVYHGRPLMVQQLRWEVRAADGGHGAAAVLKSTASGSGAIRQIRLTDILPLPVLLEDVPKFHSPSGPAQVISNAVYARPPLTFLEGPSYRSESFELHKILRAVRRGKLSAPAKFTPAPPTPSQSLASLDATLPGRRLNVVQTLHKLRWSGCKRFTSGHGVGGTVSGVEAAIHVGNELCFGVGIEVSERDQNLAISTERSSKVDRALSTKVTVWQPQGGRGR
ncbi:hypothetical protein Bbelb_127070 [Branchiostoma belcheri]|nr:hypothetical protein Bbelb_127070 [Branchiostoma belcheri]